MQSLNGIHKPQFISSKIKFGKNNKLTSKSISNSKLFTTETWIEDPDSLYIDAGFITANKGYRWITTWEQNKNYIHTKIVDETGKLIGVYWDITSLVNKNGESFEAYDWYLDVFVTSDGNIHLLDEDELNLAIKQRFMSKEDAKIAREVANEIMISN